MWFLLFVLTGTVCCALNVTCPTESNTTCSNQTHVCEEDHCFWKCTGESSCFNANFLCDSQDDSSLCQVFCSERLACSHAAFVSNTNFELHCEDSQSCLQTSVLVSNRNASASINATIFVLNKENNLLHSNITCVGDGLNRCAVDCSDSGNNTLCVNSSVLCHANNCEVTCPQNDDCGSNNLLHCAQGCHNSECDIINDLHSDWSLSCPATSATDSFASTSTSASSTSPSASTSTVGFEPSGSNSSSRATRSPPDPKESDSGGSDVIIITLLSSLGLVALMLLAMLAVRVKKWYSRRHPSDLKQKGISDSNSAIPEQVQISTRPQTKLRGGATSNATNDATGATPSGTTALQGNKSVVSVGSTNSTELMALNLKEHAPDPIGSNAGNGPNGGAAQAQLQKLAAAGAGAGSGAASKKLDAVGQMKHAQSMTSTVSSTMKHISEHMPGLMKKQPSVKGPGGGKRSVRVVSVHASVKRHHSTEAYSVTADDSSDDGGVRGSEQVDLGAYKRNLNNSEQIAKQITDFDAEELYSK